MTVTSHPGDSARFSRVRRKSAPPAVQIGFSVRRGQMAIRQKALTMPSTKLIEFRLLRNASYQQRYESLVASIKAENTTRFEEFTSAFFLYHIDSAKTLFERLLRNSDLYRDGSDMLFIMDLNTQERAHIGIDNISVLDFTLDAGKKAGNLFSLGANALSGNALGIYRR
ncbi:hypothetical protein [Devosia ginsengisoli]|uniref:hypothetical protein n=1 Tax=Devosia ginsengisoli TaxID=400770 RepID=UPI0026ECF27E|nr:hypothetical protein [Devosia ginsengisoli]MCR6672153.1 hypothetical protein [Devosia ginsengisoli]